MPKLATIRIQGLIVLYILFIGSLLPYPGAPNSPTLADRKSRYAAYNESFFYNYFITPTIPSAGFGHTLIKAQIFGQSASEAYLGNGKRENLSSLEFANEIHFRDIFLASRLAEMNMLNPLHATTNQSSLPLADLASLAATKINLAAKQKKIGVEFTTSFSTGHEIDKKYFGANLSIIIPITQLTHDISFTFEPDPLSCTSSAFSEMELSRVSSNQDTLFTFLKQTVLEPKGIVLRPQNRKTGFGDITISGILSFQEILFDGDTYLAGVSFVVPTGNKRRGTVFWEPELGNGGSFRINPFITASIESKHPLFGPIVRFDLIYSSPFHAPRRVPMLKASSSEILLPATHEMNAMVPFEEFDSHAFEFSDTFHKAKVKYGTIFHAFIGNAWRNIQRTGLSLAMYYEYVYEKRDKISVPGFEISDMNTSFLESITKRNAHGIIWNITYNLRNTFFLDFGSSHVLAGENVPIVNQVFGAAYILF